MTTRQQNSGFRESQRGYKSSQTVYVPKNQVIQNNHKQSESATQLENSLSKQQQNESRIQTLPDEINNDSKISSQNSDQNEYISTLKSNNDKSAELNTQDNQHHSRGGNQRQRSQYEYSQQYNEHNQGRNQNSRQQNHHYYTTYVPKNQENSTNLLTQSQTSTNSRNQQESNLTQSLHSSTYKSDYNKESQRDGNNKPGIIKNTKYKYSENSTPKNRYQNTSDRSSFKQYDDKFGSNKFNNKDHFNHSHTINQSSENSHRFDENQQNNRRYNRYDDKSQDRSKNNRRYQSEVRTKSTQFKGLNKKDEDEQDNQQNIQQQRSNFKISSEDFQKQLEEKMLEFMRFHDPKTLIKKDYEKNLTREQKKANKIIRDSRKNHSIIKSLEGNPLIPKNWEGLEDIEQPYEFLERKSLMNETSQNNVIRSEHTFPSLLDENTKASKIGHSSVKHSRKNSNQSSEAGKDEFKESMEQIRSDIIDQEEKYKKNQYRSSHDIESLIESHEVIPENEQEDEEGDNKQMDQNKSNTKVNKKPGQKRINQSKSSRTEYVRKDQVQKVEETQKQINQEQCEVNKQVGENQEEKNQPQEQEICDNEEIEMQMDFDQPTTQARNRNQREERDLQSAITDNSEFYSQKQQGISEKNKSQDEGEENEDGVIQRISNLEDFIPFQMTAEEREFFEKQYEDESNDYAKQKQENEKKDQIQNTISTNPENKEQYQEQDQETIQSQQSCQSPPPTENITTQDIDQISSRYGDEIVNVYTSQDSPVRVRKFSKKVNEEIVALEKQVVEQLKKEHMIEDYEIINSNEEMQNQDNGLLQTEIREQVQEQIMTEKERKQDELQNNTPTPYDNLSNFDKSQTNHEETAKDQNVQPESSYNQQSHTPDSNKSETDQTQEQTNEEVFEEFVFSDNTNHKSIQKEERDLQATQGEQLEELLKEEYNQIQQQTTHQQPLQKSIQFKDIIDKMNPQTNKKCQEYKINSNQSLEKQNITQTQDDSTSTKNNENGLQLEIQSDKNFDDTNHDVVSEYAKTDASFIRKSKLLEQFSENIKDISKSNTFFVDSIGSNIGTTFAGYVCNKIVASSLLKKGLLNQSYRSRSLFSSFSSYHSSIKH